MSADKRKNNLEILANWIVRKNRPLHALDYDSGNEAMTRRILLGVSRGSTPAEIQHTISGAQAAPRRQKALNI
jgi:hypothetical protein